jgi:opacity protein-like surface antigen
LTAGRGWQAALLALAAFASPVFAQTAPAGGHLYAGGSLGQAQWTRGCVSTTTDCDNRDAGLRVFGGWQINRMFAAEVGFANFGRIGGRGAEVSGNGWDAALVAAFPLSARWSVTARLGVQRAKLEGGGDLLAGAEESTYGPTYGAGLQWDVSPNVALRADWQAYTNVGGSTLPDTDINLWTVGALWRFR